MKNGTSSLSVEPITQSNISTASQDSQSCSPSSPTNSESKDGPLITEANSVEFHDQRDKDHRPECVEPCDKDEVSGIQSLTDSPYCQPCDQ